MATIRLRCIDHSLVQADAVRDYVVLVAGPFGNGRVPCSCKLHPGRPMIAPRVCTRSLEQKGLQVC